MLALQEVLERADLNTADPLTLADGASVHARHFWSAMKGIEPTATREVLVERPNVPWDDVGGLREIREQLESIVELPRQHPELFSAAGIKPLKGILFSGPSGTGKSLTARALATSTGLSLITADAATLLSKWLGESEKMVREVFTRAKQAAPCLLFFDELDAIAPIRGGDQAGGAVNRMVSQFLSELDSLDDHSEVVVLAATNRQDLVEPAVLSPRRFAFVLEFPMPNASARHEILQAQTRHMPLGDDADLVHLAAQSEGFSGADLAAVCQRAALREIRAVVEAQRRHGAPPPGSLRIGGEHFEEAVARIREGLFARGDTALTHGAVLPTRGGPANPLRRQRRRQ